MLTPMLAVGYALGFLLGFAAHDVAHHQLANALGDRTPKLLRRLRLWPPFEPDPLGTFVLPAIFVVAALFGTGLETLVPFGWTKAHAIGTHTVTRTKGRIVAVALAGPVATGILAFLVGLVAPADVRSQLLLVAAGMAVVLSSLTIFELLPIPGMDGARALGQFLSPRAAMKMEELAEYKVLFLLVLFLFLLGVARNMLLVACDLLTPFC